MKLALAMICKGTDGEAASLKRCLKTVAPYVDGIFITLTGPTNRLADAEAVCKEFNATISYERAQLTIDDTHVEWLRNFFSYEPFSKKGDKIFLFDKARNFNFAQVPEEYEYILWLDADDILRGGQNLRAVCKQGLKNGDEAIYFNYIYQSELNEDGSLKHVIIEHLRERIIRNNGAYKWIAPIHETVIEQRPTRKTDNYQCDVLHLTTDEKRMQSITRNLKNLEISIYQTKGEDPRPIYYLAKAYYDHNNPADDKKGLKLIDLYLWGKHCSGWPEERSQAAEYAAEMHRRNGNHALAAQAGFTALYECDDVPSVYLNIACTFMVMQLWERALFWVRLASTIPDKQTTLVKNPKDLQGRTLEVIYNASLNLSKVDEAWAAAMKMVELFPENPQAKQAYELVNSIRTERELTKSVEGLANYLVKSGEAGKVKALLNAIPTGIAGNPFMVNLHQKHMPATVWGEKDIAIYCGMGFTDWSPKHLTDAGDNFVGGSEEAVIRMSEALAKQGWNVTVYNSPGEGEGKHNNVTYLPYYKFNRLDHFNILIAWRDIRFFDYDFDANLKYLWCHDIQNPLEFTKERLDRITKVFFLSDWHRQNVPSLAEEKLFVTSNGI